MVSTPSPLYAGSLLTLQGEYAQYLFHLNLHNRGKKPLRIDRVILISYRQGKMLSNLQLNQDLLKQRLRPTAWIVMRDRQTIAAAHRYRGRLRRPKGDTIISPGGAVSLTHQFAIMPVAHLPDRLRCVVDHDQGRVEHEIKVTVHQQETRLQLPFSGRWWLLGTHRFDDHHAQAILDSQNFAYDFGLLGPDLASYKKGADPRSNSAYHANGQPILAAASGTVVKVHDGIKENEPVGRRPTWQEVLREPRDLAGNHVILRHTSREYTAYMHLKPGLAVQEGASVQAGQVLGRCGNSGNSLESHLHFQLQDGPDLLRASGLPARFSDFTVHFGHLRLYASQKRPMPLPVRMLLEPGRSPGAVEISRVIR